MTAEPSRNEHALVNPAEQRAEMIAEPGEIKQLLQEQNGFLRSGNLKVIVSEPEKR